MLTSITVRCSGLYEPQQGEDLIPCENTIGWTAELSLGPGGELVLANAIPSRITEAYRDSVPYEWTRDDDGWRCLRCQGIAVPGVAESV